MMNYFTARKDEDSFADLSFVTSQNKNGSCGAVIGVLRRIKMLDFNDRNIIAADYILGSKPTAVFSVIDNHSFNIWPPTFEVLSGPMI